MKILHILDSSESGGAENYATSIMLALRQQGIDQCIVLPATAPHFRELELEGIRLAPHVLSSRFAFLRRWKLRRLIAREKPDVIQTWMQRGVLLLGKEKQTHLPTVGWFGGAYNTAKFTACTHLVGTTRAIVAHLLKNGIAADRVQLIPIFPAIVTQPPIDRATLATSREAKVLLSLSRLHPDKGLDALINSLKTLPEFVLWLEGEGPLRAELEAQAKELNVLHRVRFLGKRADHAALLRAADVCALPSRKENSIKTILEAWAAGTPLVACACEGTINLIEHEATGLLVPLDDISALAVALRRAAKDEALRRRMVALGYSAYIKDYTRESVTRQWIDFYKSILTKG